MRPSLPYVLLSTVTAVSFVAVSCAKHAPAAESKTRAPADRPTVDVVLAPVTYQDLPESVEVSGTLFAQEDTVVSAKQAGRVVAVVSDVGDAVPSGAKLAQIDQVDFELELRERMAEKSAALAQIGLEELPAGNFDAATLPAVVRAKAEAGNAQAKFERAQRLFQQTPPLIAEQDFADIQTAWDVAKNQVRIEQLSAEAALAEARAKATAVLTAEQRLADTAVNAPLAVSSPDQPELRYFVAERLVSVGEYVAVGQPMFRLVASDILKYRVNVPERFAPSVRVGQEARVHLTDPLLHEGEDRDAVTGRVARVSPVVDVQTRTFSVEVAIDNANGSFKPGTFAEGVIIVGSRSHATLIPTSAVLTFAGVHRVYTVKDSKAVEHLVKLGDVHGDLVEVLDGLPADRVIAGGLAALSEGTPVRTSDKP